MDVVVVESPAKAKTVNKYLGSGYTVLASFGHVRDLPAKDGSVRPDEDFAMSWEVADRAKKRLDDIAAALKGADHLYLATDPDREGEAISWHVREALEQRHALDKVDVKRVVFHEVTKDAVLEALRHPREINAELVDAYLARRALDYLVGFTLSPVLWRKVPGSRSAGRVQSVALRLICERESEVELFTSEEYWTVDAEFRTAKDELIVARLTHFKGKKLDKLELGDDAAAHAAVEAIERGRFAVAKVQRKQVRRHPQPPFTTSTLQQEASRKLRLGASHTMRLAQQLYEGVDIGGETVGLITYMRTDSTTLSGEAIAACRRLIVREHGDSYLPAKPRVHKTKTRNAQEAHEAIRPTDFFRRPQDMKQYLDETQLRLYELIWRRATASQIESAVLDQVAVDIADEAGETRLRATGSAIVFDGFLALYREGSDNGAEDDDKDRLLPQVVEGERLEHEGIRPERHFTQPPPRFGEASLVKKLEELGIGRPSTYASILQVLQDRNYVRLESRRFIPEDRGRIVIAFLTNFFERYVEYSFTADLEDRLDEISNGRVDWKTVLRDFWRPFSSAVDDTKDLRIAQVIDTLDAGLGSHFFRDNGLGGDPRGCSSCGEGRLGLKLGRYGAFIGCSNYPDCSYTRPLGINDQGGDGDAENGVDRVLGADPESKLEVAIKTGPYGPYIQLGEVGEDKKKKPKRVSIPKDVDVRGLDLDFALRLLSLPRDVGKHPETGKKITAGIARYGPYIKHERAYKSLDSVEDALTVGINRAVALLKEAKPRGARGSLRSLGEHPEGGGEVTVHAGRYGPYVKHGKLNASLPRDVGVEEITLPDAVRLLAERQARLKAGGKPASKTGAKPAKRRKSPARKAAGSPAK